MSYTNEYKEDITVTGSQTQNVSYPASKNGGFKSVTISYKQTVPIKMNIHVDTHSFDESIGNCNNDINLLTGAVVATESAQLQSIDITSKKVATSIVNGFFGYIRSEISQQIAEISQIVETQLIYLKELSNTCVGKKKQMESDYGRISSRYVKIFNDLNHELSNRVFQLDNHIFKFKNDVDNQNKRTTSTDIVNTVTLSSFESSSIYSNIVASNIKKRSLDALMKIKAFVFTEKKLDKILANSLINISEENIISSPVCYFEAINSEGYNYDKLYSPPFLSIHSNQLFNSKITQVFAGSVNAWHQIPNDYLNQISRAYSLQLNHTITAIDSHSIRVKDTIIKISNIESIKVFKI